MFTSLTRTGIILWAGTASPERPGLLVVLASAFWFILGEMSARIFCLLFHCHSSFHVSFYLSQEDLISKSYILGSVGDGILGPVHPSEHCHWASVPAHVCTEGIPRCWIPSGWSFRWSWTAKWVLGTELGRAVSAHSRWASSPDTVLILRHSSSLCSLNARPYDFVKINKIILLSVVSFHLQRAMVPFEPDNWIHRFHFSSLLLLCFRVV